MEQDSTPQPHAYTPTPARIIDLTGWRTRAQTIQDVRDHIDYLNERIVEYERHGKDVMVHTLLRRLQEDFNLLRDLMREAEHGRR